MQPDVSVVVPVYNPGAYIRPLLDALDRQSIGPDRFETVFVDDGSTDGTAALLDRWAAERPNAIVIHQENHGWPGQPRNVGIDHARGAYIQFVDQDDWLGDEALERLVAYAAEHDSDVVVGKMVGLNRNVPTALFARSIPRASIEEDPLNNSQTPHKMFRRAFLEDIGLRFPEGRRRLEDHVFVTEAFLRAGVVSVYADYDCYFHIGRPDGGNAGFRRYDPVQYYSNLEDVLDVIDRWLPRGRAYDRYIGRWVRIELVGRARSEGIVALPRAEREAFYREISRVMATRIPLSAIRATTVRHRLGAILLRHATMDEFYTVEAALATVQFHVWADGGGLRLRSRGGAGDLPPDATLRTLLAEIASPELTAAVIADLGGDPTLLPARIVLPRGDGRHVLKRAAGTDTYRGQETARIGERVLVPAPIGLREAIVSASARAPVGARMRVPIDGTTMSRLTGRLKKSARIRRWVARSRKRGRH